MSPTPQHPDGLDRVDRVDRPADRLDQATVEAALRAADVMDALGRVLVVSSTASTSTDLLGFATSAPADWPDRSVLVADHQVAGRGRSGRSWTTPAGAALTLSMLLRPAVDVSRFGWVSLLAGLATVQAVGEVTGVHAVLKWPNDVLVAAPDGGALAGWGSYRKVAGVLGDVVVGAGIDPGGDGCGPTVVVGIGINVSQTAEELPVPSATSLVLATAASGAASLVGAASPGVGAMPPISRAELLGSVLDRLVSLDTRWRRAEGDAWAAGLGAQCAAVCATLGTTVRVELPGGGVLDGTATRLAADGALEVTDASGATHRVHAGDVRHLRAGGPASELCDDSR